jgi:hypothetical protein
MKATIRDLKEKFRLNVENIWPRDNVKNTMFQKEIPYRISSYP